jgi:hypothetical protein
LLLPFLLGLHGERQRRRQAQPRDANITVNWAASSLHHTQMSESSVFCYANDIVLTILQLFKLQARWTLGFRFFMAAY